RDHGLAFGFHVCCLVGQVRFLLGVEAVGVRAQVRARAQMPASVVLLGVGGQVRELGRVAGALRTTGTRAGELEQRRVGRVEDRFAQLQREFLAQELLDAPYAAFAAVLGVVAVVLAQGVQRLLLQ